MIRPLLLTLALILSACGSTGSAPPPETVRTVDLQRYMGRWYEIARFPNSFQDGRGRRCEATIATYELRPDGTVGVINRCRDAGNQGQIHEARGSAHVIEGSGGAKLRISFFWPFYGDYWILGLDPTYEWAVVGTPDRDNLWILARTPELRPGDFSEAVMVARLQGFDTARLVPTPQP